MRKQTKQYDLPIDALVAIIKRLWMSKPQDLFMISDNFISPHFIMSRGIASKAI